jgi:hypothetical protein
MDQYEYFSMSDAARARYNAQQQNISNSCLGFGLLGVPLGHASTIDLQNSIKHTSGPYKSEAMNSRLAKAKQWLNGRK